MKAERCVLVADDDGNDIFFLERAFALAEIRNPLRVVQDGQLAIEYLSGTGKFSGCAQRPLPCLLMLDLKMPRKTGMEVLEWVRSQEEFCSLPIIMLSSSVHPFEIKTAYQKGANAFVTKPSGMPERTDLARMIKGFWLTFNQLP